MHERRWLSLPTAAALAVGTGCATGVPTGGRAIAEQARFRSIIRPSPPRGIPDGPLGSDRGDAALPISSPSEVEATRRRVVELARGLIGNTRVELGGKAYPGDCAGLVLGVYDQVGMTLVRDADRRDNAVSAIYRYAVSHGRTYSGGRPLPGDLVFFRETYDVNRDGRLNDGLTHVGLVEQVDDDETVSVIHLVGRGVVRYRMNLRRPNDRVDESRGVTLNDALRAPSGGARVLTGQLFAGYATVMPSFE